MKQRAGDARNRRVAWAIGGVAVAMVAAAYAAVPAYTAFCRATGFGGTTQVATAAAATRGARVLSVHFDANVAPGLDWSFEPEQESVAVRTGATATVFFRAHNRTDQALDSTAVYNVTPEISGAWFDKISCFCFTEQHLGPHETAEWPVVFFLDPRLEGDRGMDGVQEITLSYTLFAPAGARKPVALAPAATPAQPKL